MTCEVRHKLEFVPTIIGTNDVRVSNAIIFETLTLPASWRARQSDLRSFRLVLFLFDPSMQLHD
jgi:hypothetical protein